jgi:hypothetical protein
MSVDIHRIYIGTQRDKGQETGRAMHDSVIHTNEPLFEGTVESPT